MKKHRNHDGGTEARDAIATHTPEAPMGDTPPPAGEADMVNHPPHYTQGGIECITAIRAALGEQGYRDFLRGQVIKYVWRLTHKGNARQDADKAAWYAMRLADLLEGAR